jgi:peptidoglycan/xylan/chitin deacetylase (PgdA/CDA1 family)
VPASPPGVRLPSALIAVPDGPADATAESSGAVKVGAVRVGVVAVIVGVLVGMTAACAGGPRGAADPAPTARARTIVALTFDDGLASQATAAALLHRHELIATFFVSSALLDRPRRLSAAQVTALAAAGHEIGGHTLSHARLPSLPAAEQRRELCDDRWALAARGFEVRALAYPYGLHDRTTVRLARECGYTGARASGGIAAPGRTCADCARTEDGSDPFRLRTMPAVRRDTSLDMLTSYVRQGEAHGGMVILVFHEVCAECGEYSVDPTVLEAFLAWLAGRRAHGTQVRGFSDALDRLVASAGAASVGRVPAAPGVAVALRVGIRRVRTGSPLATRLHTPLHAPAPRARRHADRGGRGMVGAADVRPCGCRPT